MIVSHNELISTVYKAFMGMRRHCGEADVIANMVADLQMIGLQGVHHFNNASAFLTSEPDCPVKMLCNRDSQIEFSLCSGSVACHLPPILDFALEKMVTSLQD